jgi:hypothetical protein
MRSSRVVRVSDCQYQSLNSPEAELDKIQTKVLLAIHSHLDSFALSFPFLQTHATSHSFYTALLYSVHRTGEWRKTWYKTTPSSLWFQKSEQKPQDYAQKPQRNCTFDPSILQHSGMWGATDEAVFKKVHKKSKNPHVQCIFLSQLACYWRGEQWLAKLATLVPCLPYRAGL